MNTCVVSGLGNEICHYLGDGSVVFSTSVENVFYDFVELIHLDLL